MCVFSRCSVLLCVVFVLCLFEIVCDFVNFFAMKNQRKCAPRARSSGTYFSSVLLILSFFLSGRCVVDTKDGISEARVSHRRSSQQHTQAGPKKYTIIANDLKNNTTGGGAKRRPLWSAAEGGALLLF